MTTFPADTRVSVIIDGEMHFGTVKKPRVYTPLYYRRHKLVQLDGCQVPCWFDLSTIARSREPLTPAANLAEAAT